jgi:predicted nucleic acid-binding protein
MALDTVVFDTSAYSAFKRGHEEAVELTRAAGRILLPAVVIGELLAGFALGSRAAHNRAELEAFCSSPRVQVMALNRATAERYAVIYAYLRSAGKPVPTNDLWIAASAMEHGAVVATADRHFQAMPQIMTALLAI